MTIQRLQSTALILALAVTVGCGGEPGDSDPGDSDPGAQQPPDLKELVTISQGVFGGVYWLSGNQMPGPGQPEGSGHGTPISREVRVYEATTAEQATLAQDRELGSSVLYESVSTPLVDSTVSTDDGFFELQLEPGNYSVFVEDEGDWYCNGGGPLGICTITVAPADLTEHNVSISYAASF